MSRRAPSLIASEGGSAAVEMALVTPLLLTLMFGSFEMGNYFLDNHVVAKAVRDGARYASRRSFTEYTCSTVTSDVVDKTRNLIRTGQLTGGTARLPGWTDPATITVSVACNTTGNNGSAFSGIYNGVATGAPVVTVSASVPYHSLFGVIGFSSPSLSFNSITLNARSQAPVMGI